MSNRKWTEGKTENEVAQIDYLEKEFNTMPDSLKNSYFATMRGETFTIKTALQAMKDADSNPNGRELLDIAVLHNVSRSKKGMS